MRRIYLFFVMLALATAAFAQSGDLDDVVARYVAARGGLSRIKVLQSRRIEGHLELPGGRTAKLLSENKRPNRIRMDFTTEGMTATRAFDGQTGWHFMPFMGETAPKTISGEELRDITEDADFDGALVDYKRKGHEVELVPGTCTFDNRPCHHLKLRLKDGNVQHVFLDRDTMLTIGVKRNADDGSEIDVSLGDYRRVEGVMFAYRSEIRRAGVAEPQRYFVDKIEVNVPIDDQRFVMPKAQ